jgi:phosphopantothenoylcysteine decarboxylase/phosphopantothenate--cysteine ligase
MATALGRCLAAGSDALIMSAAVGDFRPRTRSEVKLQRAGPLELHLLENPDVIAGLSRAEGAHCIRIAFALETGSDEQVIARAREKLRRKAVQGVVANRADEALGTDDNRAHLVSERGVNSLPRMSKIDLSNSILDWLLQHWQERGP